MHGRPAGISIGRIAARLGLGLGLALGLTLALGCRPSPAQPSAPSTNAESSTIARAPDGEPGASAPKPAPPASDLPRTCTIEIELLVPNGAQGHGTSDTSAEAAKEAAWTQACTQLRQTADVDCRDPERVGIVSQRSSSLRSIKNTGVEQVRYEFDVTLGVRRTAEGFGDAPGDHQEACRRAKAHACEQLVGGPCPDTGVRVIAVDGKPPRPAAVEPSRPVSRPRETI